MPRDDTEDWIVADTKTFLLGVKQDSEERDYCIRNAVKRAAAMERERCAKIIEAQDGMQGWKRRILSVLRS